MDCKFPPISRHLLHAKPVFHLQLIPGSTRRRKVTMSARHRRNVYLVLIIFSFLSIGSTGFARKVLTYKLENGELVNVDLNLGAGGVGTNYLIVKEHFQDPDLVLKIFHNPNAKKPNNQHYSQQQVEDMYAYLIRTYQRGIHLSANYPNLFHRVYSVQYVFEMKHQLEHVKHLASTSQLIKYNANYAFNSLSIYNKNKKLLVEDQIAFLVSYFQLGMKALPILLHEGLYHGDYRPQNVFITDNLYSPKERHMVIGDYDSLTEIGHHSRVSSQNISPPEIFLKQPSTETTDLYSLAASLYMLITHKKTNFSLSLAQDPQLYEAYLSEIEKNLSAVVQNSINLMSALSSPRQEALSQFLRLLQKFIIAGLQMKPEDRTQHIINVLNLPAKTSLTQVYHELYQHTQGLPTFERADISRLGNSCHKVLSQ
ncbi:MAG: hypothetical protein KDD40_11250 [Bdellovibrionales bacterium]|nr:hypothetical protein [Bdellovibrionales bacterium]